MKSNFLNVISEDVMINRLKGATYDNVTNAFLANYMAALLLLKLQDLKGLVLINDRAHAKLTKFAPTMSDINFWGLAMFYPNTPDVKNRMAPGEAAKLAAQSSQIQHTRIQHLMNTPMTAPSEVNWHETIGSLMLLRHRYRIGSSYFRHMLEILLRWEVAPENMRKKAVSNAFMYLMQSDPHSALLPRMRMLSTTLLVKGVDAVAARLVGFKRINEEGEGVSTGNVASAFGGGNNAIVRPPSCPAPSASSSDTDLQGLFKLNKTSNTQATKKGKYVFRDNKIVKKRKKKFKARKFKAPDFIKSQTDSEEENV